ncbi:MAG: hypothetical protein LDL41_09920 [Coleofasciculus sp. S288]|nr:hypothetical protein [Coleofasciculus sp. S288]
MNRAVVDTIAVTLREAAQRQRVHKQNLPGAGYKTLIFGESAQVELVCVAPVFYWRGFGARCQ